MYRDIYGNNRKRKMLLVMMMTLDASVVLCLPQTSGVGELLSVAGGGVGAVLEAVSQPTCSLILLTDGTTSPSTILKEESVVRGSPWGVGVFEVVVDGQDANETLVLLSHLLHQARQVRMESRCVRVVVTSHDLVFLATFAEWSLKGRLLVWATKLLVVTSLPLPQLHALLSSHWTFSMMNTILLNLEDTQPNLRVSVYTHLPYTPEGAQVVRAASWTPNRGFALTAGRLLFPPKFSNFHGATVNITALPFPPYWDVLKGPDNTTRYSGTDYYMLEAIAAALNFTIHVVPTNSWVEVAKRVEERVSFMATVFHNMLPERLERYDYSWVYEYGSLDFSMAQPGIKPQWQSLYYPLTDVVWAAVLLALLLTPVVLLLIIRVDEGGNNDVKITVGTVVQDVAGMLVGQNLPQRLPRTSSSRVLVATWLMFALIFGSAYRGNLTAFLTLPKYPPRAETLQELVSTADRITMPPYGAEFKNFFSKSDSQLFKRLGQLMHIVPSVNVGQQQAVDKKQAHLDTRRYQKLSIAKRFIGTDGTPKLYLGRESIIPGQSAWPIPHDAPFGPVLDRCLMAVIEAGLYEQWSKDLLFQAQVKSRKGQQQQHVAKKTDSDSSIRSLTTTHLQGAFLLLLLGLGIAGITFVVELLILRLLQASRGN
ncbi:ionotropic receptor 93a-like [Homarus americanus]|uniref:ionotropic receptor 93a-like n=1 Tax=Homarus americanus TaxID=6706 RepID=UPI001C4850F0|nr:ionotropic receptor 93a-like [Homarus americanus]